MAGFLITFEGGDGCGKTTQIERFKKYLKNQKIDYVYAREPGGTELGEQIRELLLHSKGEMSPETELLLFSASRNKLVEDIIKPALEAGKVVVLDRFYDSTFVYQGYAGNLNLKDIENVTKFATNGLKPDLTIVLDITYEDAMKRKSSDKKLKNLDRIESKGEVFHRRVRDGYLTLAAKEPKRIVLIDATQTMEEIETQIQTIFGNRFRKKNNFARVKK